MRRILFLAALICFSPSLLLAQEAVTPTSPLQQAKDFFNPNKGLEPKSFKGAGWEVKIKFDSGALKYQLIYRKAPQRDYYAEEIEHKESSTLLIFLDKDGFKVAERTCHADELKYNTDDKTLICIPLGLNDAFNSIDADEYRKISNVSLSADQ